MLFTFWVKNVPNKVIERMGYSADIQIYLQPILWHAGVNIRSTHQTICLFIYIYIWFNRDDVPLDLLGALVAIEWINPQYLATRGACKEWSVFGGPRIKYHQICQYAHNPCGKCNAYLYPKTLYCLLPFSHNNICICLYIYIKVNKDMIPWSLIPWLGFLSLCLVALLKARLQRFLCTLALKCASWTPVNQGTSGRCACASTGLECFMSVASSNCMGSRPLDHM